MNTTVHGVLALQGDWKAHIRVLSSLGLRVQPVRVVSDLDAVDSLVLPGGESSAMLRLMETGTLAEPLRQRVARGMPVLATCAGVILLARQVRPQQPSLGALDVDVVRNAYGRQLHSCVARVELERGFGDPRTMDGVFIRAPRVVRVGPGVAVLGRCGDDPVLLRQGHVVAATFHPELTADHRVHQLYSELARQPCLAAG